MLRIRDVVGCVLSDNEHDLNELLVKPVVRSFRAARMEQQLCLGTQEMFIVAMLLFQPAIWGPRGLSWAAALSG